VNSNLFVHCEVSRIGFIEQGLTSHQTH